MSVELFEQPFIPNCWAICPSKADWNWFLQRKTICLQNRWLQEQIRLTSSLDQVIIPLSGYDIFLKKRKYGCLKEVWGWEISSWFGKDSCVIPTFPIEIGQEVWILQRKEVLLTKGVGIERVCLEQYWKAFLLAYILGCKDFTRSDIGIDSSGRIRFFDMTRSFYYGYPGVHKKCFHPGFWIELLCWPQYRIGLDMVALEALQPFIQELSCIEDNIRAYAVYRDCSIDIEGLLFRLQKVREFSFQEGATLCSLYQELFSCMGKGLDELSFIVSCSIGRPVDHGEALYYLFKKCDSFSSKTRKEIQKWISVYGGSK